MFPVLDEKTDCKYIKHTNSGNPQHFGVKFAIVKISLTAKNCSLTIKIFSLTTKFFSLRIKILHSQSKFYTHN